MLLSIAVLSQAATQKHSREGNLPLVKPKSGPVSISAMGAKAILDEVLRYGIGGASPNPAFLPLFPPWPTDVRSAEIKGCLLLSPPNPLSLFSEPPRRCFFRDFGPTSEFPHRRV